MTPSEVAGVLGLDLEPAIRAVPFPEDIEWQEPDHVPALPQHLRPVEPGDAPRIVRMQ